MSQVIIFQNQNGGISVMRPSPRVLEHYSVDQIADRDVPKGAVYEIIDEAEIPNDRTFRDAWFTNTGSIGVDMTKAVEIKRNQIRAVRAPMLQALDIEFQKAIEANDTAAMATVAARKQALRDATDDPAILNAQTPEELKAATPAAFK